MDWVGGWSRLDWEEEWGCLLPACPSFHLGGVCPVLSPFLPFQLLADVLVLREKKKQENLIVKVS